MENVVELTEGSQTENPLEEPYYVHNVQEPRNTTEEHSIWRCRAGGSEEGTVRRSARAVVAFVKPCGKKRVLAFEPSRSNNFFIR